MLRWLKSPSTVWICSEVSKNIWYMGILQLKPSRTSLNLEDILIITIILMDLKMTGVTITNLDSLWGFWKYMISCILELPELIVLDGEAFKPWSHQEHPHTWGTFLIILIFLMYVRMTGVTFTNLDLLWGFRKYRICGILKAECWHLGSWVAAKDRLLLHTTTTHRHLDV